MGVSVVAFRNGVVRGTVHDLFWGQIQEISCLIFIGSFDGISGNKGIACTLAIVRGLLDFGDEAFIGPVDGLDEVASKLGGAVEMPEWLRNIFLWQFWKLLL